eukprot:augustus_masked-scaffold_13-processed-gene-8.16-mRNA-1 protein AED:0.87 eAED:0.87 QI:0/-1/0/1/-1/1/1/0/768
MHTVVDRKAFFTIFAEYWKASDILSRQAGAVLQIFAFYWLWFSMNISFKSLKKRVGNLTPYDLLFLNSWFWSIGIGTTREISDDIGNMYTTVLLEEFNISDPEAGLTEAVRIKETWSVVSLQLFVVTLVLILNSFPTHNSINLVITFLIYLVLSILSAVVTDSDNLLVAFLFNLCIIALILQNSHNNNVLRRRTWVQLKIAGVQDPFRNITARNVAGGKSHSILDHILQRLPAWVRNTLVASGVHSSGRERLIRRQSKLLPDGANSVIDRLLENDIVRQLSINSKKLDIQTVTGRGATGEVFKTIYLDSLVAFKLIGAAQFNQDTVKEFLTELRMLSRLRHPNVVQLMGVVVERKNSLLGFLMELMEKGSLRNVLSAESKTANGSIQTATFNWLDPKCKFALDICRGMTFLHENNIIHRDLKTENILVSATLTCKISDFATSKKLEEGEQYCRTVIGTPFWRAPEMLRKEPYTEKIDVFSFATMLLEIHIEQDPFHDMTPIDQLEFPHQVKKRGFCLDVPLDIPFEVGKLISECGNLNPDERPSYLTIRRRLQKYLDKLQGLTAVEELQGKELGKLMMDQVILAQQYKRITYQPGDVIIEYGEMGDDCYIVAQGQVDILIPFKAVEKKNSLSIVEPKSSSFHCREAMNELIDRLDGKLTKSQKKVSAKFVETFTRVHTAKEYEYFGEMALMAKTKRLARCIARTQCVCVVFSRATFSTIFEEDIRGHIANKIIKTISENESKDENRAEVMKIMKSQKIRTSARRSGKK